VVTTDPGSPAQGAILHSSRAEPWRSPASARDCSCSAPAIIPACRSKVKCDAEVLELCSGFADCRDHDSGGLHFVAGGDRRRWRDRILERHPSASAGEVRAFARGGGGAGPWLVGEPDAGIEPWGG